jgi:hypothetical protein
MPVKNSETKISCKHCKRSYSLDLAVKVAGRLRRRTVICPHCKKIVGEL